MQSKRKQKFDSSELHICEDELVTNDISFETSSISTRQLARRNALQNSHLAICESANVDGINEQPILNMDIPHNKDAMSCEKGMMIDTAPQMAPEKRGVVFKRVGSFSTTNSASPSPISRKKAVKSSTLEYPSPRIREFNIAMNKEQQSNYNRFPFKEQLRQTSMDGGDPGPSQRGMQLTDANTNIQAPDTFECEPSLETQFQGVQHSYIDLGDCEHVCQHYSATFWYEERLKSYFKDRKLHYHRCCGGGKVVLPMEQQPPDFIKSLLVNSHFLENIRAYNQMFSMTSFGAHIDESVNNGRGPYVFKISGQIYHWIGALCPMDGDVPRFLQLYIYDTENEVTNRMSHFGGHESGDLSSEIVKQLIDLLDIHNELVRLFRTARDKCEEKDVSNFRIRLYSVAGVRQYELPTSQTLGAIVFDSGPKSQGDYDVIIEVKDGTPHRINKLHPSYMSLQFPLIFIYGQPGFHPLMKLRSIDGCRSRRTGRLTMNMYYSYQLHDRFNLYTVLPRTGRLFQQYIVTAYCSMELNRMDYIRDRQQDIRNEYLSGLYDAITKGDHDGSDVGTRTILPASFTGGPRYMYSHYLDALAICRVHGNPQFFITFTCNVKWPEIRRFMNDFPKLTPTDRADVVVRIFEMKVKQLIKILKDEKPFGHVTAVLYTIEFQKRGLPHCHTLLWVKQSSKILTAEDVDKYISAELPDPAVDPYGYKVVSEMMIHGPCGLAKISAACMQD